MMQLHRLVTALILLALIGVVLFAVPEGAFAAFCVIMCLMGAHELAKMYHFHQANQIVLLMTMVLCCAAMYFTHVDISHLLVTIIMSTWCFLVPFILITQPKHFNKSLIAILALIVFVPVFYAAIQLYNLFGAWRLMSILAIAWVADIGAYYVGRTWGRHKLAASISPGKTLEGALGALICVAIYLSILKLSCPTVYLYNWVAVFKFTLILTSVAIMGDLFESWLKRVAKVKDSGILLPGHGGVFDRIDSLIAVVSVAFALIWANF